MTKKVATAQDLRLVNRGTIRRLLRDTGPLPRAELARRTGLSATTVTKVVAELVADGSLTEMAQEPGVEHAGQRSAKVGRPAIDVALVPDAYSVLGVQVGAGFVQLGLCDLFARLRRTAEFTFDLAATSPEQVVEAIAEEASRLAGDRRRVLGIGVAAPGPVDPALRRNLLSINLGWRDVPFAEWLEAALDLPAVVEHNVRAMALAEAHYGGARDAATVLYVYLRTGLGAGFVLGGQPFHPGRYGVTELGHLRVVEKGRTCACTATGCLETVLSERYLREQVLAAGGDQARLMASVEELPAVQDEMVDHLTTGLASAVNLLNPELILLGGLFGDASDRVFAAILDALRAKAFPVLRDAIRLERSTLGMNAGVVGGAAIALERLFYTPEGSDRS
ncbi:sugar kinase [Actinomadura sp. NBRC 104412]|uniref:ROK family transcriptional regulator n=1 Tax=Actinomadura sp. NBRC 104412 TaxID=3032203 RepID=UPI0024A3FF49|nr:ROK family transcriptional regulator [Actinomadura sp. NBRC 104412]GLZ07533.1 sugar kinase [Actinomadura sp. NBRC 104412]